MILMISYNYLYYILFYFYKDCSQTELVGNGVCNDESNNGDCHFDGGDCATLNPGSYAPVSNCSLQTGKKTCKNDC